MDIENLLVIPLVLIAAWFIAAAVARSAVRRDMEKLRGELKGWRAEMPLPAPAPAALPAAQVAIPAAEPAPAAVPASAAAATAVASEPPPSEQLDDEILAVLTAAVAAFLGKTVRIRRARLMGPLQPSNAWAQQGRVYVQASHNLGAR
jgi:uncharacterized protein YkwD